MSLKSKPTAKGKKKNEKSEDKGKKGVQTYPSAINSDDLVKENTKKQNKQKKKTETEQSFYGVQLFTHTWALNGSEYRASTISVSQSTLTHLHAHSHRNFKRTCTQRREEGQGLGGGEGRELGGQHERTRPWTTEADIRRGGVGGQGQVGVTTGRHHGTGHSRNMSNSWGGRGMAGLGGGGGQGHSSLRVSSGIAVFCLFFFLQ